MSEDNEKTEVIVNVEVTNDSSKNLLIIAIIVIVGVGIALSLFGSGDGGLFSDDDEFGITGSCGDGIDNDGGGQADRDDPDCYHEPEVWKGYDESRNESNGSNDPPQGRP